MEFEKSSLIIIEGMVAQSERFELPSHGDTGFQIRAIPGYATTASRRTEGPRFFLLSPLTFVVDVAA